jgi:hypothetical protein
MVYDWQKGHALGSMAQPAIMGFAVSEDGSRLLTRNPEQSRLWDVPGQKMLCERKVPSALMDSLSPDGKLAATVPTDKNEVILWNPYAEMGLQTSASPSATAFPAPGLFSITAGSLGLYQLP